MIGDDRDDVVVDEAEGGAGCKSTGDALLDEEDVRCTNVVTRTYSLHLAALLCSNDVSVLRHPPLLDTPDWSLGGGKQLR